MLRLNEPHSEVFWAFILPTHDSYRNEEVIYFQHQFLWRSLTRLTLRPPSGRSLGELLTDRKNLQIRETDLCSFNC